MIKKTRAVQRRLFTWGGFLAYFECIEIDELLTCNTFKNGANTWS